MEEKIIAWDTEYNSSRQLMAISVHDGIKAKLYLTREEMLEAIGRYRDYTWVSHNSKSDVLSVLTTFGYIHRKNWCTMISDMNINKGLGKKIKGGVLTRKMVGGVTLQQKPWSLPGALERYLGIPYRQDKEEMQLSFLSMSPGDELTQQQKEYALSDVEYLLPLREAQMKYIQERGLEVILENVDFPCIPIFAKKEFMGVRVDVDRHKANIARWKIQKEEQECGLYSILTRYLESVPEINFASPKQLLDTYKKMGWPLPLGATNSGFSFADGALEIYLSYALPEECRVFTEKYRDLVATNKLLSTYGESFLAEVRNGRVYSQYSLAFTDTGRIASSNVNLNNIPKDGAIRNIFIPDEGYVFVDADHAGQEVCLAADFSQEPVLMKAFVEGFDYHSYLASESFSIVFRQPVTIVNEKKEIRIGDMVYDSKNDLRQIHKNVLFTKFYGGGAAKVLLYLGKYIRAHNPPEEAEAIAKKVSARLDQLLPVLTGYLKKQVEFAKVNGYNLTSKLGRRRYYENPKAVFGDSMNVGIQGAGSESIKIAEIKLDRWVREKTIQLGLKPDTLDEFKVGWGCMNVYDSIVFQSNELYQEEAKVQVEKAMKDSLQIFLSRLQAGAEVKVTKMWS